MQNVNGLSCVGCNAGMLSQIHTKADQHCRAKRLFVDDTTYIMICCKSSLIRQLHHFATDFDRVLLQLEDILDTV